MQEIQRFNKVLKSCVLFGDIILLNSLLWGFELVLGSRFYSGNLTSLYQGMVLSGLQYSIRGYFASSSCSSGTDYDSCTS